MDEPSPRRSSSQTTHVFVWGRGGDGQLGVGNDSDQNVPVECVGLREQTVLGIACGGKHCCAVTKQGDVYSWGWNYTGQLGHGDFTDRLSPVLLKPLALAKALTGRKIVGVAAGSDHTVAVTDEGTVYTWGGNVNGQLGIKAEDKLEPTLLLSLHLKKISSVVCGGGHTMILTENGIVYSWGRGANGRCGHGELLGEADVPKPKEIIKLTQLKTVDRVTSIACGWSHSMCLTKSGQVYVWGRAADGRLGVGGTNKNQPTDRYEPELVTWFVQNKINIRQISGGYYHSAALDTEGRVYTWGWGEHGQLGHGNGDTCFEPVRVDFTKNPDMKVPIQPVVLQISCGGFHTTAVTTDGRLFAWGLGEHGQLGVGPMSPSAPIKFFPVPALVPGLAKAAYCGWWHTIAITEEQEIEHARSPSPAITIGIDKELQAMEKMIAMSPKPTKSSKRVTPQSLESFDQYRKSQPLENEVKGAIPAPQSPSVQSSSEPPSDSLSTQTSPLSSEPASTASTQPPSETGTPSQAASVSPLGSPTASPKTKTVSPRPSGRREPAELPPGAKPPSHIANLPPPSSAQPINETSVVPLKKYGQTQAQMQMNIKQAQQVEPSGFEKAAVFLANVFFQEDVHQKTVQINRKKTQALREQSKIQKVTEVQNEIDQKGLIWTTDILPRWEKMKNQPKTIELWKQGIPSSVRGLVWQKAIGNKLQITPDRYNIFSNQARTLRIKQQSMGSLERSTGSEQQSPFRLIEVDVPRTFGSTQLFLKEGPYYKQLMEILETYAIYRPDVGYVQGMSYLAGMLLLYNDTYNTFVCFSNLLNNHFLISLFKMDIKQV